MECVICGRRGPDGLCVLCAARMAQGRRSLFRLMVGALVVGGLLTALLWGGL